jgi:hypothetical protein
MSKYDLIEESIHDNKKLEQENLELKMKMREYEAFINELLSGKLVIKTTP